MDTTVAETIISQIGKSALFMLGAKKFVAGSDYLGFKIGRNPRNINYVRITLTPEDLYDIEYFNFNASRTPAMTLKDEDTGVYCDMLAECIGRSVQMDVVFPRFANQGENHA